LTSWILILAMCLSIDPSLHIRLYANGLVLYPG
jgi:hypothetical protein